MTPSASTPLALDTQTHHGDWQIPHVHDALRQHRWGTVLGKRAFIRFDDVHALFKDGKHLRTPGPDWLRASNITEGPLWDWWQHIVFSHNGESHRRLRGLVNKAFAAHSVEAQRAGATQVVQELGEMFEQRGEIDAVADFAHWMPARAICRFLGIPEADVPVFERWTSQMARAFTINIPPEIHPLLDTAVVELTDYMRGLIADRRQHPRADLLSSLAQARDQGDRLSEDEMIALSSHLLLGAHDTTKCTISCALLRLLRDRDQWRALCADPALAEAATEESLRCDPVATWLMRVVAEPFTHEGLNFEAGELFVVTPLGANHDPARFPQSERFDLARKSDDHLAFGLGPHFCIGAWIGRMYVQETLRMFATRFPDMQCVEENVEWTTLFDFRRPQRLRIRTRH